MVHWQNVYKVKNGKKIKVFLFKSFLIKIKISNSKNIGKKMGKRVNISLENSDKFIRFILIQIEVFLKKYYEGEIDKNLCEKYIFHIDNLILSNFY